MIDLQRCIVCGKRCDGKKPVRFTMDGKILCVWCDECFLNLNKEEGRPQLSYIFPVWHMREIRARIIARNNHGNKTKSLQD